MAMFNGATNVTVNGGSFVANADIRTKAFDKLVDMVAPNGILNAGGRADEVRCFPGTREEVIRKLEQFMDDGGPGRKRMMWLSGPAGAGKSAICQTVAERRSEQAANFFFFRGDSTRSHSKSLVATLAYQLCSFYPALEVPIFDCLSKDPLICNTSIGKQFRQLISSPIQKARRSAPIQQPIVIIIDGLDECNNDRGDQDQILAALHTLVHADDSPFRILVSSRAEPQLVMSFNRLGSAVESIFLNDDYKPQEDIRRFVVAKFAEIKKHHHLARSLNSNWPTTANINAITDKSSGHFIYAATVMRYIQFSSASPALSLDVVLEMAPVTSHNPLAHLDAIYSHIFSKVHNIHAVKLVLFARNCTKSRSPGGRDIPTHMFGDMLQLVGYTDLEVESFFADLVAIIEIVPGSKSDLLVFYHASLEDYLADETRSTIYYVNGNEVAAELTSMCLGNIHKEGSIRLTILPLSDVKHPTPGLSNSLLDASSKRLSGTGKKQVVFFDQFIGHIERLYWEKDKYQFKVLLQYWSRFVYVNDIDKLSLALVGPNNPSASQYYEHYWMTEGYSAGIGNPVGNLSIVNPGASPGSTLAALPKVRRGVSPRHKVPHHDPSGSSTHKDEEGYESRNHDDTPYKLNMIRVKLHHQDDIRVMSLTPDMPFSEFVDRVAVKFGKNLNDLIMKFKDEDGDKITLCDASDYEHAIEAARQGSKGKAGGKLEIWCEDRA